MRAYLARTGSSRSWPTKTTTQSAISKAPSTRPDAAVPFNGSAPPLDAAPQIKATLQLHFAENDERINATWPPYEGALKAANVTYEAFSYPGTQHGLMLRSCR